MDRALDVKATLQQALAHHRRGELDHAQALYRQVLAQSPAHFDALHLLGVAHYQQGQHEAAVDWIRRALAVNAGDPMAHSNLGLALRKLSRFDEAMTSFERALAQQADHLPALNNRASTLRDLGRYDEALADYDRALGIDPRYIEARKNRGALLLALGKPDNALRDYDQVLALAKDDVEALFGRGNALMLQKRPAEAIACYDRVLSQRPDHADALRNRGSALLDLDRVDEALESLDRSLALQSEDAEALNNRGNALVEKARHREALACFERAVTLVPHDADAAYNASLCALALGDYTAGWQGYESRLRTGAFRDSRRTLETPMWRGDFSLADKTVLLHWEQGLGDTLQFCRYAPLVAAQAAAVVLEVQPELAMLSSSLGGGIRVIAGGDPLPPFDCHCALLSLPRAFTTTLETIPGTVPYLHADAVRVLGWQERLRNARRPLIGLAWAGGAAHKTDHKRSIPLATMARLASKRAQFVSLQKELRPTDNAILRQRDDILHVGDALHDFADTAALVESLDLVVSADTAVAHLAGALGKEVWILLPFNPDWRWLLTREHSPWYPTALLYRQTVAGDWNGVIQRVAVDLAKRLTE